MSNVIPTTMNQHTHAHLHTSALSPPGMLSSQDQQHRWAFQQQQHQQQQQMQSSQYAQHPQTLVSSAQSLQMTLPSMNGQSESYSETNFGQYGDTISPVNGQPPNGLHSISTVGYVPLQAPSMSAGPRLGDPSVDALRPELERRLSLESGLNRHSSFAMAAAGGSGYHTPGVSRRRRSDSYSFANDAGPFFTTTRQLRKLYTMDRKHSLNVLIHSKMDRGFFLAENDWTCYRRNYFQVSSAFSVVTANQHPLGQPECPCLIEDESGACYQVNQFNLGVTARVANSDKKIDLVQHTPKRDKGPQTTPLAKPIRAGGNLNMSSVGNNHSIVTFERVQFKTATANNGKRRAAQQYYVLLVELLAETSSGQSIRVATAQSAPLVVRGRSPGHYADHHDRFNPLGAIGRSASHHGVLSTSPNHLMGPTDLTGLSSPFSPYSPSGYSSSTSLNSLNGVKVDMSDAAAAAAAAGGGNSVMMSSTPGHLDGHVVSGSASYPFPPTISDISSAEPSSDVYNSHDPLNATGQQHQMTSPITPAASNGTPYDDQTSGMHNMTNVYQGGSGGQVALALTPTTSGYGSQLPSISEVPTHHQQQHVLNSSGISNGFRAQQQSGMDNTIGMQNSQQQQYHSHHQQVQQELTSVPAASSGEFTVMNSGGPNWPMSNQQQQQHQIYANEATPAGQFS